MDFKARFLGKSSNFTKNGIQGLLSSPGIPIDKTEWQNHVTRLTLAEKNAEEKRIIGEIQVLDEKNQISNLPMLSRYYI